MAREPIDPAPLRCFLQKEMIASLPQLKRALGSSSTMTVFRKLKALGYLSSYSHRGQFYTLHPIPDFDAQGLWSFHSVWFSRYGNLVQTARQWVQESPAGHTAQELESLLHVDCKAALLKLCQQAHLRREKITGLFVYFSATATKRGTQRLARQQQRLQRGFSAALADELKAAIILFHSLLDEKQRRLFAGLEAHKLGRGGDEQIAALLGLDRHTVAKGRRELLGGELCAEGIRKAGAGRKPQEKKRRPSASGSKPS